MANQWFRFYHEFATDPKVQMLPENIQRRYVMLLCLKCCNGDVTLHETEIAFQLRINSEEWEETKRVLQDKKLIDKDCQPTNWNKRQYVSDSSTERVRKLREKNKTLPKRERNVTVTPPDTDTDSDTEVKKETNVSKKTVCLNDLSVDHIRDWLVEKRNSGKYMNYNEHEILEKFKGYCHANGKRYKNYIAAYRNAFDWDNVRKQYESKPSSDKYQRSLEAAARGHMRAENPDF